MKTKQNKRERRAGQRGRDVCENFVVEGSGVGGSHIGLQSLTTSSSFFKPRALQSGPLYCPYTCLLAGCYDFLLQRYHG